MQTIVQAPFALPLAAPAVVRRRAAMRSGRGFTLIELMIAVSVAGILSSIALPSFESQLLRSRRADVLVSMMQIQAAQERFRSNATNYGSLVDIGVPSASPARYYNLQAGVVGADSYEALAIATGIQARDTACRYMKLSVAGANLVYASGPDAATANPADANRTCWSL